MWVDYYKTPGEDRQDHDDGAKKKKALVKLKHRQASKHQARLMDNTLRTSLQMRLHDLTADIDGLLAELRSGRPFTLELLFHFVRTLALNSDKGPTIYY